LFFDPTDPDTEVGDLPEQLQGSFALIVADDMGGLVRLPVLPPENSQIRRETGSGADGGGKFVDNEGMAHCKTERNPLFAGRWFEDEVILLCPRWYFRFKLSYRDLVEILSERGLVIAHTTILRRVIRYAETCEKRWRRFEGPVGGSWRRRNPH
jgi:hypothetical protein